MVAGRNISRDIAMDTHLRSQGAVNVLINESAAKALGFSTPEAALNQVFYEDEKEKGITTYTIVGVDEADVARGRISWISPLARSLIKAREGDSIRFQSPVGVREIDIVGVVYERIE